MAVSPGHKSPWLRNAFSVTEPSPRAVLHVPWLSLSAMQSWGDSRYQTPSSLFEVTSGGLQMTIALGMDCMFLPGHPGQRDSEGPQRDENVYISPHLSRAIRGQVREETSQTQSHCPPLYPKGSHPTDCQVGQQARGTQPGETALGGAHHVLLSTHLPLMP